MAESLGHYDSREKPRSGVRWGWSYNFLPCLITAWRHQKGVGIHRDPDGPDPTVAARWVLYRFAKPCTQRAAGIRLDRETPGQIRPRRSLLPSSDCQSSRVGNARQLAGIAIQLPRDGPRNDLDYWPNGMAHGLPFRATGRQHSGTGTRDSPRVHSSWNHWTVLAAGSLDLRKPEGRSPSTVRSFVTDGDDDLTMADSIAILLSAWRGIGDEEVLEAWAPLP
jgi:hypothetical protein